MRKLLFYLHLFFSVLPFALFFSCSDSSECSVNWENVPVEQADLVFRRGGSMASRMVISADKTGLYSHVGVVVFDNGCYKVIHVVPGESEPGQAESVKMEPLSSFFSADKALSGCVMRLNIPLEAKNKVASEALKIYARKVLFDHKYDLEDVSKMYCTELVWNVFKAVQIDITNGKRTHVHFSMFDGDFVFPSDIQKNKSLQTFFFFNNQ